MLRKISNFVKNKNKFIDCKILQFFDTINEYGKLIKTSNKKDLLYKLMIDYLLEVLPEYNSSQKFLGTIEQNRSFLKYKKKRFLEVAKPCDVILIKGNQRISKYIQTLTKSPYSHAVYYKGDGKFIESDPEGILLEDIDKYIDLDIRICRPVMLSERGKTIIDQHMDDMMGLQPPYDIENVEKLLFKYWYTKFRPDTEVYIGGSSDFEKYYICSGLIAHGFHKAGYPIVPSIKFNNNIKSINSVEEYAEIVKIYKKNYSQIVPSDFDISPFFASVKFLYLDSEQIAKKRFKIEHEE